MEAKLEGKQKIEKYTENKAKNKSQKWKKVTRIKWKQSAKRTQKENNGRQKTAKDPTFT